ncbi:MAG: enoyl-CoA hydratase/isomerase family protein [Gemmatimonadetes bacterium]|nr:enoyl-CoA hydratase/isomerase family protein [Gemmatimonadota bacterium]
MSDVRIIVEKDASVGWIRINRPERLNAFSGTMRTDLLHALQELEQDPEIRSVIITGVGRAFSTGGDISVMAEIIEENDRPRFEQLVRAGADVVRQIDAMTKPVIAAINGAAAGAGACLTLACDLRIASETASIGFTFLRVGLHPDWGGSFFLPRLIGPAAAAEFIFTGGMISAERGERLGLFNRVVPAAELESAARGFAGEIAASPANVVADAKRVLRRSLSSSLTQVLELEVESQLRAFESPDFREGITAFMEKRSPKFSRPRPRAATPAKQEPVRGGS